MKIRAADTRPLSTLALAPTLSDLSGRLADGAITIACRVANPLLLAPALAGIASRQRRRLSVNLDGHNIVIGSDLADAAARLAVWNEAESMTIAPLPDSIIDLSSPELPPGGIAIPEHLWQRFDALAVLTYVPASETSRLAGAGAGLLDND
jgi:hypothetical protein